jgi:hypothetical protein
VPNWPIKNGHQSENQRGYLQACTLCPLVLPFPCLCLLSLALARTDRGLFVVFFRERRLFHFGRKLYILDTFNLILNNYTIINQIYFFSNQFKNKTFSENKKNQTLSLLFSLVIDI